MKAMRGAAVAAVVVAMLGAAWAVKSQEKGDDAKKGAAAEMQLPKPGPEQTKLNFLIGSWTMTGEYSKSPMTPDGGKEKGWYKAQAGPGGFSVLADFNVEGPWGPEIGHEVLTWTPWKKAYTVMTVGNAFPGAVMGTGNWEGENLAIESTFVMGTEESQMRAVYSNITEKSVHMEEFVKGKDGAWVPIWKGDATK